MKKIFQKIFSQKKFIISIAIFLLIFLSLSGYTLIGISKNVHKMQSIKDTTYYPEYPEVNIQGKNQELIRRGEYLAKAGDCIACHTNTSAKGKPFAGGLAMQTPFGTIYSPNITADKETGIGNWTDSQFIKAMREGISPHGHYYYPAFPYLYFNKIKTEDLTAIKAYLNNIPTVHQKNQKNAMVFPFNIRFLQLGWRILFFKPEDTGAYKPNYKHSEQWNRGAYLVQGLGHCAMCHSPYHYVLNDTFSLGAPIRKYDLTGAKIQGYLAPNITMTNLAKVPEKDIVAVFTHDLLIGGGKVQGPMLEVDHDSLKYLSSSDLGYIANYLKVVKSETPPKPKGGPGKGTYEDSCSGCHATGSGGSPKYGDAGKWAPIIKAGIDKAYFNALHGIGNMPAKGSCLSCSDEEIKQAVNYMITAVQGGTGKSSAASFKENTLTLADGKHIYENNCSVCHETGFKGALKPGNKQAWKPIINEGFLKVYQDVVMHRNDHLPQGTCKKCSDSELKVAIKYMMQQSANNKNFMLW